MLGFLKHKNWDCNDPKGLLGHMVVYAHRTPGHLGPATVDVGAIGLCVKYLPPTETKYPYVVQFRRHRGETFEDSFLDSELELYNP